jgi:hypothetical protein
VSSFGNLVVIDKFGESGLCPTPWGLIDFVRKNAHGYRGDNVFHVDKTLPFLKKFPI